MALKAIMLRAKIDRKKGELEQLLNKDESFHLREKDLEKAIQEAKTDEEQTTVAAAVEQYESEKNSHEASKTNLQSEIEGLEEELRTLEEKAPNPETQNRAGEKGEIRTGMERKTKFFGMTMQERASFFANAEVKAFLERTREIGKASATQKRTVTGTELTIPTVVLDLIRENIMGYSKLVSRVKLRPVSGTARQTIMGTIPEAVWTEMCAKLNELDFGFTQTEVDGYKVGGVIYICEATLDDSDYDLASEIISALGTAIGIALDKAILYGFGTKMPMGIVTRLAQTSEPSNYSVKSRPWKDLHETNMITIAADRHGLDFYKDIVKAGGKTSNKYARGNKFWAMNENTYTTLKVEAMTFNAAGAIIAVQDGTMPVAGGDIIILSDDIIADNNIVAGYGELYLLAERAGSSFARSDDYRFAEDQVAFKGTARYDGEPVIAEGFIVIGLGVAPATSVSFMGDTANDATLEDLAIGTETLSPIFAANKYDYAITAAGSEGSIQAVASQDSAKIAITYGGKKINNGSEITFSGTKDLVIEVTNGLGKQTYTVKITKSGG